MVSFDKKIQTIIDDVDDWDLDTLLEYAKDMREEEMYRKNSDMVDEIFNQIIQNK